MTGRPRIAAVVLGEAGAAYDATVFSLACQDYRPLEIASLPIANLEAYRRIAPFDVRPLDPGADPLEVARGSSGDFVAFFRPGQLVYPGHFERLVRALDKSCSRWGVAPVRWATVSENGAIAAKKMLGVAGLSRPKLLLRLAELPICSALFSRDATPALGNSRSDGWTLLRFGAITLPGLVDGLPSCEARVRHPPASVRLRALIRR